MKNNFKLHHLRDFVAIAQHRSVRAAARHLDVAQPSLTRSLRELERELVVPVMERHARGVTLTPSGERFLVRASNALNEIRRAGEEARQFAGEDIGSVSAALSATPMLALAPYAVPRFHAAHPGVSLRIVEGTFPAAEARLLDGQLDLYAGAAPDKLSRKFHSRTLFNNQLVVMARKGHPLAEARRLRDLQGAQWMQTGLRDGEVEAMFRAAGLEAPQCHTSIESVLGLLTVISQSDCLAALPRQWTDIAMFRTALTPIAVRETLAGPPIVLITRAGIPLTPAAEQFATLLERAAGPAYAPGKTRRSSTARAPDSPA